MTHSDRLFEAAKAAMQGILSSAHNWASIEPRQVADKAIKLADELLKKLEERK